MAILSYFTLASLATLVICGSNSADLPRSSRLALSQKRSAGFLHLDRRDGSASEGIKIDAVCVFIPFITPVNKLNRGSGMRTLPLAALPILAF